MSLFKNYKEEREGAIVVENDYGFASAIKLDEHLYIDEIYVLPEHRKLKVAANLADELAEIAKELKYTRLLGSVDINANNSTISLKVLLAYGFYLYDTNGSMIYLEKGI